MGIVRMGPPEELILSLKETLDITTFVETGTFKGGTAAWASSHFERVITIENSKVYFDEAKAKYVHLQNTEFLFGDSREALKTILPALGELAIFWLDAHWCSLDSYGSGDQCPIIEEVDRILSTGIGHCIFIDDARLFLSPPPLPNRMDQWPAIDEIVGHIKRRNESYYIVVFEDVIIVVPEEVRALVGEYCQAANTKAWEEYRVPTGWELIGQGAWLVTRDAWHFLKKAVSKRRTS